MRQWLTVVRLQRPRPPSLLLRVIHGNAQARGCLLELSTSVSRACACRLPFRALGTHDNKEIPVEGRVQFDLLELIRRDHKLKSYSLNYVSSEFLKEQKVNSHHVLFRV